MENEQLVSLQGLIKWALEERIEQELAQMPIPKELEVLYPDTSAFDRRVFGKIKQRQKEQKKGKHVPLKVLKKMILAAAILVSILFGTLMTNATVRNAVVNTIIDWTGRDVGIRFEVEGEPLTHLPDGYGPHFIPERFSYLEEISSTNELDGSFSYSYETVDKKSVLSIEIGVAQRSIYRMDNEHTEFEMITFQNVEAYVGHWLSASGTEGYSMLWVKDGMEHYIYGSVSLSEIFEIAENIY